MKHAAEFKQFLPNEVNLSLNRRKRLNRGVKAVRELLSQHLDGFQKVESQGSYALNTIIRPVNDREYDADILVYIRADGRKGPKDYINGVYECLRNHKTYRDKVRRKTRCVVVNYVGDFHLDVVPCINQGQRHSICNNQSNKFEVTDGTAFRDWFNAKADITNGDLKQAAKLLKYLRDHKGNFAVPSIVLTTLIGNSVNVNDKRETFKSVPETLKVVSNRVNSILLANSTMPRIKNPVMRDESFTRHWDQRQYSHFRKMFDTYNRSIDEAFEETNSQRSLQKWQHLFGPSFGLRQQA